jgi:hypothetical protein
MVFVMSLFFSTAVADDGLAQAMRAAANDPICASFCPIILQVDLRRGK